MNPSPALLTAAAAAASRAAARFGRTMRDAADDGAALDMPVEALQLGLPTAIYIVYENAAGEESERVVTLVGAWLQGGAVHFRGRCHLRQALRDFRADRVVEMLCLSTGEVVKDCAGWLMDQALYRGEVEADYTPTAVRLCRDELALLAYVANADGVLDPDEVEVAVDYVMMSTDRDIDRDRAAKYIRRLSPCLADLDEHLARIARKPDRWVGLMRAMRRLVDADREVTIEEQVAWAMLSERFDAASMAEADLRERLMEAGHDLDDPFDRGQTDTLIALGLGNTRQAAVNRLTWMFKGA